MGCQTNNLVHTDYCRDLVAELPFTLMHPKPEEEPENNKTAGPTTSSPSQDSESAPAVDTNLIELDTLVALPWQYCTSPLMDTSTSLHWFDLCRAALISAARIESSCNFLDDCIILFPTSFVSCVSPIFFISANFKLSVE